MFFKWPHVNQYPQFFGCPDFQVEKNLLFRVIALGQKSQGPRHLIVILNEMLLKVGMFVQKPDSSYYMEHKDFELLPNSKVHHMSFVFTTVIYSLIKEKIGTSR